MYVELFINLDEKINKNWLVNSLYRRQTEQPID